EARKPQVSFANERDCLAPTFGHIPDLASLTISPHPLDVLRGMQIFPPRAVGAKPISDTQSGTKIRAQKDNLTEGTVSPNQPRSDASKEYDRSHRYSAD